MSDLLFRPAKSAFYHNVATRNPHPFRLTAREESDFVVLTANLCQLRNQRYIFALVPSLGVVSQKFDQTGTGNLLSRSTDRRHATIAMDLGEFHLQLNKPMLVDITFSVCLQLG